MYRSLFGRRGERRGPRSRALGCLLWLLLLIVLLIVLAQLFGGFRKGTKADGLGLLASPGTAAPLVAGSG